MSLVLVTHNMGVVADMARRVAVMYAGQVVEERSADTLFGAPQHPYRRRSSRRCRAQPRPRASRDDPRRRAWALRPAAGVPVRVAVCACDAALRRRAAGAVAWRGGEVRCHYPLGDTARGPAIFRDGPVQRVDA